METISRDNMAAGGVVGHVDPGKDDGLTNSDILEAASKAFASLGGEDQGPGPEPEKAYADVAKNAEEDHQLKGATMEDPPPGRVDAAYGGPENRDPVEITDEDKAAFIEALVSNSRFKSSCRILGGRIRVVFRSRTVGESEAIDAHVRREMANHVIETGVEYMNLLRLCLLVSSVEQVGDLSFPEMSGELRYSFRDGRAVAPEWVKLIDGWRKMPEGLVNSVLPELLKFEAKYMEMVKRGSDENFWSPGGSTGA